MPWWVALGPGTWGKPCHPGRENPELVGGKGAGLARLFRHGFRVPPALALTTAMFEEAGNLDDQELAEVIKQALKGFDPDQAWAVRSSAQNEDGAQNSFAGQMDTFLNVRGVRDLVQAVRGCWESADSAHAALYAGKTGRHAAGAVAVVFQPMVAARCAGVLFTRHPARPDRDAVVVEGVPGLGEALVSGQVTPHRVELSRHGKRLSESGEPCLDKNLDRQFAFLAARLEQTMGGAQDAEWAHDGQTLWLLQCRPVTARPREVWTRLWGDEFWAQATTPLQFTFLGRWIQEEYFEALARIQGWTQLLPIEPFRRIHSHVYFNSAYLLAMAEMVPPPLRMERFFQWLPPLWRAELPGLPFRRGKILGAFVRGRMADKKARMFSHYKMLPDYVEGVRRQLAHGLRDNLARLTDEQLFSRLSENDSLGKKHFQFIRWGLASYMVPTKLAVAWMDEHWTGTRPEDDPAGLGLEALLTDPGTNQTKQVNQALMDLAEKARKIPDLSALADRESLPSLEEVRAIPGADSFVDALDEFLNQHGHRGTTRELHEPRWMDDPSIVLGMVLALSRQESGGRKAVESPDLEAIWLKKIRRNPGGKWKVRVARKTLELARAYSQYRENQRYALDYILADMRHVVLEMARRMASDNRLKSEQDVFFLKHREFLDLWRGTKPAPKELEKRKKQFFRDAQNPPPMWIMDGKSFGGREEAPQEGNALAGTGASPGSGSGPARVVRSAAGLSRVRPGEVLVAPNTDPGWTPVFPSLAGLVVETGGMLSHAAVVAREYGVPAVTGVVSACDRITDGQMVRVDGTGGAVYLEEDSMDVS